MSGVMALLSLDGRAVPESLARAQLGAIAQRGNRAPRLWSGEGITLGHVNLPMTPEAEREVLPAADRSGRYWISWDGRLDNRETLAEALGLDAAAAREWADAEYALAAFERWGEMVVQQLVGDWAILIWDARERRLFCARDPMSLRPLFYAEAQGLLAVGSEPQQLFAGDLLRPEPNQEYVLRYLGGAMQERGSTCYTGLYELESGQALTASAAGRTVRSYWTGACPRRGAPRRIEEYVEEFIAVFRTATRAQLRSNRPIGVYLSGGLDSSYVAAIAAQEGANLHAITLYAPGTQWCDERRYARLVVDHLGLAQTEVDISDCWALSSRWLPDEACDEPRQPPQGPHIIRRAIVARDAGLGVMLDGEGGDEWMEGDDRCVADALLHGRPRAAWEIARAQRPWRPARRTALRSCYQAVVPFALQDAVSRARHQPTDDLEFSSLVEPQARWIHPARFRRSPLWRAQRCRDALWLGREELARSTKAWVNRHALSRHQIEARSPFNDLRVVEVMATAPEWAKRFRGRRKDILREAGYRVLPREIFDRPEKAIFNEVFIDGLRRHERERLLPAVEMTAAFPGISAAAAVSEVQRSLELTLTSWRPIWSLATTGLWLQYLERLCLRSAAADSGGSVPAMATALGRR